jgi:hypothetical protein
VRYLKVISKQFTLLPYLYSDFDLMSKTWYSREEGSDHPQVLQKYRPIGQKRSNILRKIIKMLKKYWLESLLAKDIPRSGPVGEHITHLIQLCKKMGHCHSPKVLANKLAFHEWVY